MTDRSLPSGQDTSSEFLDSIPLSTAGNERELAKRWVETAAQHARNETYWKDRALKAEGWTSAKERDDLGAVGTEDPYVIIDCRTIVGNTPLFWMPNGNGYGSVVSEIGRYSKKEAFSKRGTDFPVPLRIVVEAARPRVDIQLLNTLLDRDGLNDGMGASASLRRLRTQGEDPEAPMSNRPSPSETTDPTEVENGKAVAAYLRGEDGTTYDGSLPLNVWRCRPKEGGAWLIDPCLTDLAAFLAEETTASSDTENPRSFVLQLVTMTGDELARLGEFDGW